MSNNGYPLSNFDCECIVKESDVIRSRYNREKQYVDIRSFCPKHPEARLVDKTYLCLCGTEFTTTAKNAVYCAECRPRNPAPKTTPNSSFRPPEKPEPIVEEITPKFVFYPGYIGMDFPLGFGEVIPGNSRSLEDKL